MIYISLLARADSYGGQRVANCLESLRSKVYLRLCIVGLCVNVCGGGVDMVGVYYIVYYSSKSGSIRSIRGGKVFGFSLEFR